MRHDIGAPHHLHLVGIKNQKLMAVLASLLVDNWHEVDII